MIRSLPIGTQNCIVNLITQSTPLKMPYIDVTYNSAVGTSHIAMVVHACVIALHHVNAPTQQQGFLTLNLVDNIIVDSERA